MTDREILAYALRTNFDLYLRAVFRTLYPSDTYVHNWHIDAIIHELGEVEAGRQRRLIINICPRSLKSTIVSVAFSAWRLGQDPSHRLLCVSYSDDLARHLSRQTRIIMESDWYQRAFPLTRINKSTELEITTTSGGSRYAASILGPTLGRGGNTIILDDPMSPEQARSDNERAKILTRFAEKVYSRMDRKELSALITVMQRLHEFDLTGLLLEKGGYRHLCLPAICPADQRVKIGPDRYHDWHKGEALHPNFESLRSLEETRKEVGEQDFATQYLQAPRPREGNLFKSEHLRFESYERIKETPEFILQSWDTASKAGDNNDYSVCTTIYALHNKYYIADVLRGRWTFPELVKLVRKQANAHRADVVLIEDAGSGIGLIQELGENSRYSVLAVPPQKSKWHRAERQTPIFAGGRVIMPDDQPWVEPLIHELLTFPKAKHDDQVDSLIQGLAYLKENYLTRESLRIMPGVVWGGSGFID